MSPVPRQSVFGCDLRFHDAPGHMKQSFVFCAFEIRGDCLGSDDLGFVGMKVLCRARHFAGGG